MVSPILSIVISAVDRASGAVSSARESALRAQEATARSARVAGIAMAAMGAAALLASRQLSKSFQEVEAAFANVSTLMEETDDAMEVFGDTVVDLSTKLPVQGGQLEIVNGLYQVLSAGITDTADAQSVLTEAIKAGIAGVSDTFTAVDLLTTAINAYGLSAEDASMVSDVLFTVVKRGKVTFTELSTVMGRLLSVAAPVGIGLEEVAASMATLTALGLPAEQAATALAGAMNAFLKPAPRMEEALMALGFESAQMAIEELGLVGALQALSDSVEGDTAALAEMFPNVESLRAILPLTGVAAEKFAEDLDAMRNSAGAAGVAFGKAADTMGARITIAKNRIDAATLSIGEGATPAMAALTEAVAFGAEGMVFFNEATGGALGALLTYGGAALTAIGPVVALLAQLKLMAIAKALNATADNVGTGSLLLNTAASIKAGVVKAALAAKTAIVTAAQWAWNVAMSANPIGLIILAIAALVAAIVFLVTHWDQVRGAMEAVWNFIKPVLIPVIEALTFVWNKLIEGVQWFVTNVVPILFPPLLLWKALAGDLEGAWAGIVDFFTNIWNALVQGIANFGSIVADLGRQFLQWLWDGFIGIFAQLWNLGVEIMQAILDGIWDTIRGAGSFFTDIGNQIVSFFTGSPQLNPRLRRLFGGVGAEMGAEMGRGMTEGIEAAGAAVTGAAEGLAVTGVARRGAAAAGTQVNITIGSIVASGAEEGRLAAEGLMDELRRRGVRVGLS